MTEQEGGARPAADRPAAEATVDDTSDTRRWQPNHRHVDAFDRWIIHTYGPEVAARYGIRRAA